MNPLQRLLGFLSELERREVYHKIARARPEAIMVEIAVPGERWEVEFHGDGRVDVEVYALASSSSGGDDEVKRLLDSLKK